MSMRRRVGESSSTGGVGRRWGVLAFLLGLAIAPVVASVTWAASVTDVIIGANVYDEGFISKTDQDAEVLRLASNGVKTIRTGLSTKSIYFITEAYKRGIGAVVIAYPTEGSNAKPKRGWSDIPLSGADPQAFAGWLKPLLDQLESAGVRLTAIELGNEINTSGYNGDIPKPGSGRVLGLKDLDNPDDAEAVSIAAGLRNYLKVMASLKDVRDQSKLNRTTPILPAGLADWGLPSIKSWNGQMGVGLPDTIAFLQRNGLDKLADGYAVHVYPTGDPKASAAARIAELEQKKIFSQCRPDKPCWLTEWGISNGQACPLDDSKRVQAVAAERAALESYVAQKRLAAAIWFTWAGLPGPKEDPSSIYRCGILTASGKLVLSPLKK